MNATATVNHIADKDTEIPNDADLMSFVEIHFPDLLFANSRDYSRIKRKPELFFFLFNLFRSAFRQIPAGSLPNDDLALADAAEASDGQWLDMKHDLLAEWHLGADGRWRHPVLTKIVLKAWRAKKPKVDHAAAMRQKKAANAAARKSIREADARSLAIDDEYLRAA